MSPPELSLEGAPRSADFANPGTPSSAGPQPKVDKISARDKEPIGNASVQAHSLATLIAQHVVLRVDLGRDPPATGESNEQRDNPANGRLPYGQPRSTINLRKGRAQPFQPY